LNRTTQKVKIGIYNYSIKNNGGGEKKTAVLADHLSRTHDVLLISCCDIDIPGLERYFGVDLSRVQVLVLREKQLSGKTGKLLSQVNRIKNYLRMKSLNLDLFINCSPGDTTPNPAPKGIYMCMFPRVPDTNAGRSGLRHAIRSMAKSLVGSIGDRMKTYTVITANSFYTSKWLLKWWNCPSTVIYSAAEPMGPPAVKEKIIVHVGRFTAYAEKENHPKRQEVMLEVFKGMQDLHKQGWQMHFVGSSENSLEGRNFIQKLQDDAQGYPVQFHCNIPLNELRELYRRAAIYWHATGYGFSENEYPGRQEHFGLTTVEAMSAGVVPVVINTGGQRETVAHGTTGFRWDTLQELAHFTRQVTDDPDLKAQLSRAAIESAPKFSKEAFLERMDVIVEDLIGTPIKNQYQTDEGSALSTSSTTVVPVGPVSSHTRSAV
jgi:glycosyltransferase involved in cell wall biosynthesis